MLVPKATIQACRYGGYAAGRRKATRLLPRREDQRPLVVHRSGGLPLLFHRREWRGRRAAAHADRRPRRSCLPAFPPRRRFPRRTPSRIRCAIRCRSTPRTCRSASAANGGAPSAQLTSRRMRAWGLNTAYGPALNDALPRGSSLRQPYVFPLRGWQQSARRHHGPARRLFRSLRAARRRRGGAAARAAQVRSVDDRLLHRQRASVARARKPARRPRAGRPRELDAAAFQEPSSRKATRRRRARRWCMPRSRDISRS